MAQEHATSAIKVGAQLGRYELVEELGRGASGAVFKARDPMLDTFVSVKVLIEGLAHDTDAVGRFKRELLLARRVAHPGVCKSFDLQEHDGHVFLVMEYVEGEDLSQRLQRLGRLNPDVAVNVMRQAASALGAAHSVGVVHRDLKPANILIREDGRVSVVDFGIATSADLDRLTRPGLVLGSRKYVAPERWTGGEADPRADVWSLGVMLYGCLTGRLPFRGEGVFGVLDAIQTTTPPAPSTVHADIPAGLDAIVTTALQVDPDLRYQTGHDLEAALAPFDTLMGGPATRSSMASLGFGEQSGPATTPEGIRSPGPPVGQVEDLIHAAFGSDPLPEPGQSPPATATAQPLDDLPAELDLGFGGERLHRPGALPTSAPAPLDAGMPSATLGDPVPNDLTAEIPGPISSLDDDSAGSPAPTEGDLSLSELSFPSEESVEAAEVPEPIEQTASGLTGSVEMHIQSLEGEPVEDESLDTIIVEPAMSGAATDEGGDGGRDDPSSFLASEPSDERPEGEDADPLSAAWFEADQGQRAQLAEEFSGPTEAFDTSQVSDEGSLAPRPSPAPLAQPSLEEFLPQRGAGGPVMPTVRVHRAETGGDKRSGALGITDRIPGGAPVAAGIGALVMVTLVFVLWPSGDDGDDLPPPAAPSIDGGSAPFSDGGVRASPNPTPASNQLDDDPSPAAEPESAGDLGPDGEDRDEGDGDEDDDAWDLELDEATDPEPAPNPEPGGAADPAPGAEPSDDAKPPDRRSRRRASASPEVRQAQKQLKAARSAVSKTMRKRSLIRGDDAELDRLLKDGSKKSRAKQYADAAAAYRRAEDRAKTLAVDRAFVTRKLNRLNRRYDSVKDPAKQAKVGDAMRKAQAPFVAGDFDTANRRLTEAFSVRSR